MKSYVSPPVLTDWEANHHYKDCLLPDPDNRGVMYHSDEGHFWGVVTYTMKNIGKETHDVKFVTYTAGAGKFIYGDGYSFEDGWEPRISVNEGEFSSNSMECEPLSDAVEVRFAVKLPEKILQEPEAGLTYNVSFGEDTPELVYKIGEIVVEN